jgi:hypothetical protein
MVSENEIGEIFEKVARVTSAVALDGSIGASVGDERYLRVYNRLSGWTNRPGDGA